MEKSNNVIEVRTYGSDGRDVVLLHGGPGARGYMRPVAEELAKRGFQCHEPLQRRSGEVKLTVAVHVFDLQEFMTDLPADTVVVRHSAGANVRLLGL
ncbi:MAG: alpha/beta hydrolase [Planctomycetota bacterium]|nr:alpha/beta hydrolase [Planctomycetota bacterium]